MTAEQWQIALRLYSTAQEIAIEERRAFIDSASADPEVVHEVLDLLEASMRTDTGRRPAAIPTDRTGTRAGRYEIGKLLGRGAMGEVYAAHDTELDRPVALKFLLSEAIGEGSGIRRFVREARAASALNHPNILTVYEVVYAESGPAIAMELVEGRSFREFRGTPLASGQVVHLGRQIASALAAAHEKGIIHRDIKPENLMLREDGLVKVLDFGLAREFAAHAATVTQTTGCEIAAGTPPYMSPEQLRGDALTGASDVFSLGIVLYELATGRHPFKSEYAWETAYAIHTREAAPLSSVNRQVPAWLDRLILSMLQRDAGLRPSAPDVERALASSGSTLRGLGRRGKALRGPRLPVRARWAALALLVISFAAWVPLYRHNSPSDASLQLTPLTSFGGRKRFAALSPDGTRFAFTWDGDFDNKGDKTRFHIYVKPVSGGDPRQLTFSSTADDLAPSWSPDGRSIAFCRDEAGVPGYQIYVAPADGGAERKEAENAGLGVSWSADGKTLAWARRTDQALSSAQELGDIHLLSLESGQSRKLTASHQDYFPEFSPDGKWIAFIRSISDSSREMLVMPAGGGPARQLTFDGVPAAGLAWTADSREIVFSSFRKRVGSALWRVSIKGGEPRRILALRDGLTNLTISRRGGRLAYNDFLLDTNVYLRSGPGFQGEAVPGRFGEPAGVAMSSRADHSPAISPNGERIAFVSGRSGYQEIWISRRDGTQAVQLTSLGAPGSGTPRWSPDGRWIAFDSQASGKSEIYIIDSQGGIPRQLTAEAAGAFIPSWSADAQWIYFTSRRSGRTEIWKIRAAGGPVEQVTHGGAFQAVPSPDGRLIYFTRPATNLTIWSMPAAGGPESPVPELKSFNRITRSWGVLNEGIYFLSAGELPLPLVRFFSFRTRKVTSLFPLQKETLWDIPALDLSQDGRYALTVQLDHKLNDVMMIENFR